MNDYLKIIGEQAELFNNVTIYRFKGAEMIETVKMKFEVLTSHTMRKTFVENALDFGMPKDAVKSITGHKSDKDFNRYHSGKSQIKAFQMDTFAANINATA